jgi:putative DNA primase/helicase
MDAATIAKGLRGGRKVGTGWVACCPAHEDSNPSLAVRDSKTGSVLVHCHAGCSQSAVIRVLKDLQLWSEKRVDTTASRRIVAAYDYTDESGELLYQVVRMEPKSFFQRYPDGAGGWINRKHPQQVLYRLPEVVDAKIVFVCEGEKDVETLRAYRFVATTLAGGANAAWLPAFTDVLRGREQVVLVPDNDPPGWALMRRVANGLLGAVARLTCFDDHHRAGAKDISDWFAMGHSEVEFVKLLESTWRTI